MDSYFSNKFINHISDFDFYSCKFSPFEKNLIATSLSQYYGIIGNGRVSVFSFDFSTRSLKEVKRFNTNDACFDLAWSESNENILASVQGDGSLKIWDMNNQFPFANLKCHGGEAYSVNWNNNQPELVLTSSQDLTVKLHDVTKMTTVNSFLDHKGVVYNATWHPTLMDVFASCSEDGTFKIWDIKSPQPVRSIKAHNGHAMSCDFNKYQNFIATAGSDGSLAVWDLKGTSNVPVLSIKAHSLTIKKLVYSPFSANLLGTAGYDMNVRLWDTQMCQQVEIFKHHREFVMGIDFSALDENLIATCGWDRTLNILNWKGLKYNN